MAEATIKKAEDLGNGMSIMFVDESGVLKAFFRMDHSALVSVDVSRKKAVTAVGMGIPGDQSWYEFIKGDPILNHGLQQFIDFILPGGGSPVPEGNTVIGAIGISGGHYKQDELCAESALEAHKLLNS